MAVSMPLGVHALLNLVTPACPKRADADVIKQNTVYVCCIQGDSGASIKQSLELPCIPFGRPTCVWGNFYKSKSIIQDDGSLPEVPRSVNVDYSMVRVLRMILV